MARISLVPVIVMILLVRTPLYVDYLAAAVFVFVVGTGALTRYITRSHKQITNGNRFLDRMVDKLLILAVLISFVEMGRIKAWIVIILVGGEFAVSGLRAIAAGEGMIVSPSRWDQYSVISQSVAIVASLVRDFPLGGGNIHFSAFLFYLAVLFSILSGGEEFLKVKKFFEN